MSDDAPSIYGWLASQVELYVQPLRTAAATGPSAVTEFVTKATGVESESVTDALLAFAESTTSVASNPETISNPSQLKDALRQVLDAWTTLTESIPASAIAGLFEYLAMQWIWSIAPATYSTLVLVDVIDDQRAPGERVRFESLEYLWKPANLMREVYGWESNFAAGLFVRRLANLGKALRAPAEIAVPSAGAVSDLALVDTSSGGQPTNVLILPLLRRMSGDAWYAVGVNLIGTPGDSSNAALTLVPFGVAGFPAGALAPGWSVKFRAAGVEGLGIAFRPPRHIEPVRIGSPIGDASFELTIERDPNNPLRLSLGTDFRVSAKQVQLYLATDLDDDFTVRFKVVGLEIKIGGNGGDGFLSKVLPKDGLIATSDFVVAWSAQEGLRFEGGLGFLVSIPLHLALGPISLSKLSISVALSPSPVVTLEGRVDVGVEFGPIQTSIAGIGVGCTCDLARDAGPDQDGARFGPLMMDIGFLAPTGAGLSIAAGPVTGGGFIRHEGSTYSGILNLKFAEIGLVAVAIITTKFPDGRDGFALFINIGVTFSPPITLPYNFNLQGCGGLCAVNRTMDTEALRSGLRNKTLDSILFPENPILNASKIISDSERVFPIEEGRYVFGPMVKLGWGAKGLITANIAIVIELPAPLVIALLGQFKARVPQSEDAKVKLNLDVLGVLEVEKKSLSFDATLYDSKILVYELYGDSAMRLRWGSSPQFALSVGGFHPRFNPPPNFPSLRRLTLALSSSNKFELKCQIYHALTSNSLQFGAKLTIHAAACGAALDGYLSFDTLFQFSPFEFEVGIAGGVSASYKGHDIASVRLSFDLSGPTPWHAKGKAKVSVLCWDVTARFNKTWGSDNRGSVARIDPLPEFLAELNVLSNWNAALSPRRTVVESLKSLDVSTAPPPPNPADAATAAVDVNTPHFLAHPAGSLEFRQRLLPLDLKLDKFKNVDVKDHTKFDVRIELGPMTPSTTVPTDAENDCVAPAIPADETEVKEHFARAQYKSLSKADRLSKPSFERFRAGVQVGPNQTRIDGCVQECELEFESILILPDGVRERCTTCTIPWSFMRRTLRTAALRRAGLRNQRMGKFGIGGPPRVGVEDEGYAVVDKTTLTRAERIHPRTTPPINQTQAEDLIQAAIAEHLVAPGSVLVVPEVEEVV